MERLRKMEGGWGGGGRKVWSELWKFRGEGQGGQRFSMRL